MVYNQQNNPTQQPPDVSKPPTERILAMRNQNMSNNEIIQSLQREGYNSDVILDGINQADLKNRVEGSSTEPPGNPNEISNPMQYPTQQQSQQQMQGQPQDPYLQQGQEQFPPMQDNTQQMQGSGDMGYDPYSSDMLSPMEGGNMPEGSYGLDQVSLERIEEIAEAIIDEKWNEIIKSINKIIDWKEKTENQINKLEQRIDDMQKDFENLNKGVLGKIGEYDKNITNLGVEIKAMERVFQKIIPNLTENVHALEKLTHKLDKDDTTARRTAKEAYEKEEKNYE
ncbi:MAG: hypothetical protein ACOCZQ_00200 [Nanoarchaeota archaeon]